MGSEAYYLDQRLGSVCTINNKDAYGLFNADLKELSPVAGSVAASFSTALGASSLDVVNHQLGVSGVKAVFYVGGINKEFCYTNVSNLIAECCNCIIRTDEDRFEYAAVLTSYAVKETGVDFYNEVTLTFSAVKRLPLVVRTFDGTDCTFTNVGSLRSGVKIRIVPKSDLDSLVVSGITISNLASGQPFVIDGLEGKVTCNGINKFLDTDLIEFPKVNPGHNNFAVSSSEVVIEVSYYPTFVI